MRPMLVVMVDVLPEHSFELMPIGSRYPIQALTPDGADEALSEGVGPGSPYRVGAENVMRVR